MQPLFRCFYLFIFPVIFLIILSLKSPSFPLRFLLPSFAHAGIQSSATLLAHLPPLAAAASNHLQRNEDTIMCWLVWISLHHFPSSNHPKCCPYMSGRKLYPALIFLFVLMFSLFPTLFFFSLSLSHLPASIPYLFHMFLLPCFFPSFLQTLHTRMHTHHPYANLYFCLQKIYPGCFLPQVLGILPPRILTFTPPPAPSHSLFITFLLSLSFSDEKYIEVCIALCWNLGIYSLDKECCSVLHTHTHKCLGFEHYIFTCVTFCIFSFL